MNPQIPSDAIPGRSPASIQTPQLALGTVERGAFDNVINTTIPFNGTTNDMAYYFELQVQIARETLFFQTISNILKARQDASLNSVRNMRS